MQMILSEADVCEALGFWLTHTRMRTPVTVTAITQKRNPAGYAATVEPMPVDAIQGLLMTAAPALVPGTPVVLPADDPRVAEAERLKKWNADRGDAGNLATPQQEE